MPRRALYPRNEQSRRDRWAYHEQVIAALPRQKLSRTDAMLAAPHGATNNPIVLTGTAITGGMTEEMMVNGGETVIITLSGDTWALTLGDNNATTTAFLAAITGDDAGSNGFDAEVALVHGNLVRTSNTIMTLTIPAGASYAVATDETITVAPPASSVDDGIAPATSTFDVTANVIIALTGTAVAGGVLESEIVTGSETVIITVTGDTWVATLGADNAITTAFLAAITGDLADVAGWNAEVALVHGNLVRTNSTTMTLTTPATAGYSITTGNETVTVAPQALSLVGGIAPVVKTFVITEGS